MNNRYLFRAKRKDNRGWEEGFYAFIGNKNVIIIAESGDYYTEDGEDRHGNEVVEVNSSTICQCSGRKDKDGNLIFEHDIVKEYNSELIGEVKFGEHEKGYGWYIAWISERAKYYRTDFLYWQKEIGLTVIENAFNIPADWKKTKGEEK